MLSCKRVLKQREDIPRYGNTINNSFLGTVCSNIFFDYCLFKKVLMYLSTKLVGKEFSLTYFLYGPCKTHKKALDKYSPFKPILLAIKTPSCNLAKFLVSLIEPFT